jgi:1-aminocyclopropane-1-carboxylate deaminase/D-cysteine desulfhydrase-like pyridoxal-dependent ACC family enzyme
VGSGCTTAGLLAGFALAHQRGWAPAPPIVRAVRVTPWPVTSRWRLAHLAARTLAGVATRVPGVRPISTARLRQWLTVDGRYLGAGYGHLTRAGEEASAVFATAGLPALDGVYAAKAAAALLDRARTGSAPLLFWLTKSSTRLPTASDADVAALPADLRRWLGR